MTLTNLRFIAGFALLAAFVFGGLGYAIVLLFTGHFIASSAVVIGVLVLGKTLPPIIAWLVMLGYHPPPDDGDRAY